MLVFPARGKRRAERGTRPFSATRGGGGGGGSRETRGEYPGRERARRKPRVGVEAREASAKRRDDETSGVAGRGERGVEKDAGCRKKKKSSETAGRRRTGNARRVQASTAHAPRRARAYHPRRSTPRPSRDENPSNVRRSCLSVCARGRWGAQNIGIEAHSWRADRILVTRKARACFFHTEIRSGKFGDSRVRRSHRRNDGL